MILRDIFIENWRCIRRLELTDLPDGLVVLHGPNRTGKSSIVLALRNCLFDADHDAASKDIKSSLPWDGTGPPKVRVTFTTEGATYRLTKVFSKKKDGMALLEKQIGSLWQPCETAPKEASRRARELLRADKSDAGLNQLLWLTQGEISLPDPKNLDDSLQQKLVGVLGAMMTPRDFQFKEELDNRCATWFTETGRNKEQSPLNHLDKRRVENLKRRNDERLKWDLFEDALRRLHACEDELPSRQRAAENARAEVNRLTEERDRCAERLRRHDMALGSVKTATLACEQANKRLADFREAQERMREAESALVGAQQAADQAQQLYEARLRARDEEKSKLAQARAIEEQHARGRNALDDCRKLVTLSEQMQQVESSLKALAAHEEQIVALEKTVGTLKAPDEAGLKNLRENRRQADKLRAHLQAGLLTLTVTMQRPMHVTLDGAPARPIEPASTEAFVASFRQRAAVALADVGTVEVTRAHADQDLERAARDLAILDRDFQEQVGAFAEDPSDEACLDRLVQKQLVQQTQTQRLKDCRNNLHALIPEGRGSLEAKRDTVVQQIRIIHQRRPDLAAWQPCAAELDKRFDLFENGSRELEVLRRPLEDAARLANNACERAEADMQAHKRNLAGAAATAQAARGEIERFGEEATLLANVSHAAQELARAEQTLSASQLTEDEQKLDQRFAEAKAADVERAKRLRDLENQINEQRGFLQGNEGLHARLMDAEALLIEVEANLARERLEADAHKRLRDLFGECRENQVQQVMGPVASRVLEWSHRIGLRDYREVRFGDNFMPQGAVMAGSNPDEPILFDHESYGTAEQLSLLVRLALGGILAMDEPGVAILDDPLAHADPTKHRNILNILRLASEGNASWNPPAGPLQILVLTCHPERFDHLPGAAHINLDQLIQR